MRKTLVSAVVAVSLAIAPEAWGAVAGGAFAANARSFQEVPAISSSATIEFTGTVDETNTTLTYTLTYSGFRGDVTQAHIHFGQMGVNGGIVIFLCSNLGNGPEGTQACPESGTITGTATTANVGGGASAQGIAPGAFNRVTQAIRQGVAYVNVHTTLFPGGEARGQIAFTSD
ncbi:MAG TPA: CHRD domain-containing protein [Thermoanaerobaculia bacterium]|jgi:hypothetical protein|nr:CHRD domain-containing protein [Thermoanaerobaculia bacterium]